MLACSSSEELAVNQHRTPIAQRPLLLRNEGHDGVLEDRFASQVEKNQTIWERRSCKALAISSTSGFMPADGATPECRSGG